jgi:predicted acyl esterase
MASDPTAAHSSDYWASRDMHIPMPDGITLAAALLRAELPAPYPGICDLFPDRKGDNWVGDLGDDDVARRGSAVVHLDGRGTGDSEIAALDEYCPQAQPTAPR